MDNLKTLIDAQDWHQLVEACNAILDTEPDNHRAAFVLAVAQYQLSDYYGAFQNGLAAFEQGQRFKVYADFMSAMAVLVGKSKDSYFYAKMASCGEDDAFLNDVFGGKELYPDYTDVLKKAVEYPLIIKGFAAAGAGNADETEHWFRQHIAFYPEDVLGYHLLADFLLSEERLALACEVVRGGLHKLPDDVSLLSKMAALMGNMGEFAQAYSLFDLAHEYEPENASVLASKCNAALVDPAVSPKDYLALIKEWADKFQLDDFLVGEKDLKDKEVINVGWVVSGVDKIRFAPALAMVLSNHNSKRFRFIGFGDGDISDAGNMYFQKCFDDWRASKGDDPYTLFEYLKAFDIDILVNCAGFAAPELMRLYGSRVCPVQTTLGVDALDGFKHLDAQFTSSDLLGDDQKTLLDTGAVYQISEVIDPQALAERKPSGDLVFGCDANFSNLTPTCLKLWVKVLKQVPNSMLVLRNHDFEFPENTARLISLFGNYGMAHRVDIIATATSQEYAEHIDIFLVPPRSNYLGPVQDILSCGVPIVFHQEHDVVNGHLGKLVSVFGNDNKMAAHDDDAYITNAAYWVDHIAYEDRVKRSETFLKSDTFDYAKRMGELEAAFEKLIDAKA